MSPLDAKIGGGTNDYIPIPGTDLPFDLGGLFLDATMSGTASALEIDIGLAACTAGTPSPDICTNPPIEIVKTTFDLTDACPTPSPTPSSGSGSSSKTSAGGSKLGGGAIAGAVIGSLIGAGLLVAGVVYMRKRQAAGAPATQGTELAQSGGIGK